MLENIFTFLSGFFTSCSKAFPQILARFWRHQPSKCLCVSLLWDLFLRKFPSIDSFYYLVISLTQTMLNIGRRLAYRYRIKMEQIQSSRSQAFDSHINFIAVQLAPGLGRL